MRGFVLLAVLSTLLSVSATGLAKFEIVDNTWTVHKTTAYKGQVLQYDAKERGRKVTKDAKFAGVFRRGLAISITFGPFKSKPSINSLSVWLQDSEDAVQLTLNPSSLKFDKGQVTIDAAVPVDHPVGSFELVACDGDDCLALEDNVAVIFNAYTCNLNDVDREEYVERPIGAAYYPESVIPWTYNHHRILPAVLHFLVTEGANYNALNRKQRKNEVDVVRFLTNIIADKVLVGNWNLPSQKGPNQRFPTEWRGSEEIVAQAFRTGEPVEWGQCWVFAAVLTGCLRSVGIPARPVTNVGSAHEKHYSSRRYDKVIELTDKYGGRGQGPTGAPIRDQALPPTDSATVARALRSSQLPMTLQFGGNNYIYPAPKCKHKTKDYNSCFGKAGSAGQYSTSDCFCVSLLEDGDSAWNFHVWTEAYLKRDGKWEWNAADATWQEPSFWDRQGNEVYAMGPARLSDITNNIYKDYDADFVTSETNARLFNSLGTNIWFDPKKVKQYMSQGTDPASKKPFFFDGRYGLAMYTRIPGCTTPWLTYRDGSKGGAKGHCALDLAKIYRTRPHGLALLETTNHEDMFNPIVSLTKRQQTPDSNAQFFVSVNPEKFMVGKDITFTVSHTLPAATKVHYSVFITVENYAKKQLKQVHRSTGYKVLDNSNRKDWFRHTVKVDDYLEWINRKFDLGIFVVVKRASEASAPVSINDAAPVNTQDILAAKQDRDATVKKRDEIKLAKPTSQNKRNGKFDRALFNTVRSRKGTENTLNNAYKPDEVMFLFDGDIEVIRPELAVKFVSKSSKIKEPVNKSSGSNVAKKANEAAKRVVLPPSNVTPASRHNAVPSGNGAVTADVIMAELEGEETQKKIAVEADTALDLASRVEILKETYPDMRFTSSAVGIFKAGEEITVEMSIENPFPYPLTNMEVSYSGPAGPKRIPLPGTVGARNMFKHTQGGISVGHTNALTGLSITLLAKVKGRLVAFRGVLEFKVEGEKPLPLNTKWKRHKKPGSKGPAKAPAPGAKVAKTNNNNGKKPASQPIKPKANTGKSTGKKN